MEKGLFNQRVYEVVRRIPKGKVATYGQVAALAGAHATRVSSAMPCIRTLNRT